MPTQEPRYSDPKLREQKLALNEVDAFVESLGYEVVSLEQQWRHVTGELRDSSGQSRFFKLASTAEISLYTANERLWYEHVGKHLNELSGGLVFVPQVFNDGRWGDKYYYVGEFIRGESFPKLDSEQLHNDVSTVRICLSDIAKIAATLAQIQCDKLWSAPQITEPAQIVQHFFKEWDSWRHCAREAKVDDMLIQGAERIREELNPKIAHGDFSIGNLLIVAQARYALIDGEHAYSGWPAFYDIANMTHRLGTRDSLSLASKFFRGVEEQLPVSCLPDVVPSLCYCCIRGFFELKVDRQNQVARNKHLQFARFVRDLL